MKIGSLAVPYGSSKYHAEVMLGALKGSNGQKVLLLHNFGKPTVLGHAKLIETERDIYAVLHFAANITYEHLTEIAKCNKIGGFVEGCATSVAINSTSAIETL